MELTAHYTSLQLHFKGRKGPFEQRVRREGQFPQERRRLWGTVKEKSNKQQGQKAEARPNLITTAGQSALNNTFHQCLELAPLGAVRCPAKRLLRPRVEERLRLEILDYISKKFVVRTSQTVETIRRERDAVYVQLYAEFPTSQQEVLRTIKRPMHTIIKRPG